MNKIIPFYKAEPPFMDYIGGFGSVGVIMWDSENDKIQCHMCGKWFDSLTGHIKAHDISPTQYKEEVGLYLKTPLWNLKMQQEKKEQSKEQFKTNVNLKASIKANHAKGMKETGKIGGKGRKKRLSVQEMNKFGTCEIQLKTKILKLAEDLGHTPTFDEAGNLAYVMVRRFGTWGAGLKYIGLMPMNTYVHSEKFSKDFVIEKLREYIDIQGKEPTSNDFRVRHLMPFSDWTVRKFFPSLEKAMEVARQQ